MPRSLRSRRLLAAFTVVALLWLGAVHAVDPASAGQPALSKCMPADWAFVAADLSVTKPWTGALTRPTPTPAPVIRIAAGRPSIALAALRRGCARHPSGTRRPLLVGTVELRI